VITMRLVPKKVPTAWVVRGNELIPIDWDEDGRILKAIEKAVRAINRGEKAEIPEINNDRESLIRRLVSKVPLIF